MPVLNAAGGLGFTWYEKKAKKMSDASLEWSALDAHRAWEATRHDYYKDEAFVYRSEILRRRMKRRSGGAK
jgi:cation transport regulator ChaB